MVPAVDRHTQSHSHTPRAHTNYSSSQPAHPPLPSHSHSHTGPATYNHSAPLTLTQSFTTAPLTHSHTHSTESYSHSFTFMASKPTVFHLDLLSHSSQCTRSHRPTHIESLSLSSLQFLTLMPFTLFILPHSVIPSHTKLQSHLVTLSAIAI